MAKNHISGVTWMFIGLAAALILGFVASFINSIQSKKIDAPIPVQETNAAVETEEIPEPPTIVQVEEIPVPAVTTNKVVKFTMWPKLSATSQEVHSKDKK